MDISTLASLALGWARRAAVALGGAGLVAAGAACNSLFDVRNPNDVLADSLNNPAAGFAIASGAQAALAYGWGAILTEYATVTDELTWRGTGEPEWDLSTRSRTRTRPPAKGAQSRRAPRACNSPSRQCVPAPSTRRPFGRCSIRRARTYRTGAVPW